MTEARTDRVLIVHPDPAVRRDTESALRRAHKFPIAARQVATPNAAIQAAREHDPRIIVLDLGEDRALTLSVARELRRIDRLIIGLFNPLIEDSKDAADVEFLRQAVRAGIGEFVPLPVADAELSAALASVPETRSSTAPEGRAIAFFSHQGGVGTTTLALSTALTLSMAEPRRPVALMDANIQFGAVAAHLGMVPDRDLSSAIRELDQGVIAPLPTAPDAPLAVLASPSDPRIAETITPEDASRVLIELRRRFQAIVIDTAPILDMLTLSVLDLADTVVVVTDCSAPTVAGAARTLKMLADLGFDGNRVRLVANKFRNAADALPPDVIATELRHPVDHVVPFIAPVSLGTHRGAPALFERGAAPFADAIRKIAGDVARLGGRRA